MIPVVALIGRPNVGKSTLFNRFTKSQHALVADFPGLTRDRQYGDAKYDQKPFIVVDTGGIGVDDLAVDNLMSKQSKIALDDADIVLFVVDGRSGITSIDEFIAKQLRQINKPVLIIVNKTDGLDDDVACGEFQHLGFKHLYPVSATHGTGMDALQAKITTNFSTSTEEIITDESIRIAFVGRPNVGKSTLINRLLKQERVVVYDLPGTTRDSIDIPFSFNNKNYTLIDTAGVRRRSRIDEKIEKFSVIKTLQAIKGSQVCVMLLDGTEGVTDQDMHLLSFIIESGRALVIAANKWDGLTEDHKTWLKNELERRLHFASFAKIRFISALQGSGVGLLFKDINDAYACAIQSLSTPKLTRLLIDLVEQHPPPLINGRRIKLRYAHAGGHNPPLIIIHGNQLPSLPESYKRYLTNAYIKALNLAGTPLKLEFKGHTNPFKTQKNKLSARQVNKKKRLLKHVKRR